MIWFGQFFTNIRRAGLKRPIGRMWPSGCSLPTPLNLHKIHLFKKNSSVWSLVATTNLLDKVILCNSMWHNRILEINAFLFVTIDTYNLFASLVKWRRYLQWKCVFDLFIIKILYKKNVSASSLWWSSLDMISQLPKGYCFPLLFDLYVTQTNKILNKSILPVSVPAILNILESLVLF